MRKYLERNGVGEVERDRRAMNIFDMVMYGVLGQEKIEDMSEEEENKFLESAEKYWGDKRRKMEVGAKCLIN